MHAGIVKYEGPDMSSSKNINKIDALFHFSVITEYG